MGMCWLRTSLNQFGTNLIQHKPATIHQNLPNNRLHDLPLEKVNLSHELKNEVINVVIFSVSRPDLLFQWKHIKQSCTFQDRSGHLFKCLCDGLVWCVSGLYQLTCCVGVNLGHVQGVSYWNIFSSGWISMA